MWKSDGLLSIEKIGEGVMDTSALQEKHFIDLLFDNDLLDRVIDWISGNMNSEDVFSQDDLTTWVLKNGMIFEQE